MTAGAHRHFCLPQSSSASRFTAGALGILKRASRSTGTPSEDGYDVLAEGRSAKALRARPRDAFGCETFALPREQAREKAREMFRRFPKAAYMTEIESWRELPGERIEFTLRRLPSAD